MSERNYINPASIDLFEATVVIDGCVSCFVTTMETISFY